MTAPAPPPLRRLAESPRLFSRPEFVDEATRSQLLALALDDAALAAQGVEVERNQTGRAAELPLQMHPALGRVAAAMEAALGMVDRQGGFLRMRHYGPGAGHPAHADTYEEGAHRLLATALLCLQAPESGGQTLFPDAAGGPLAVPHRAGQLVGWRNVLGDGETDWSSRHLGVPVVRGDKVILGCFFYGGLEDLAGAAEGERASDDERLAVRSLADDQRTASLRGFGRAMAVIDDGVPVETISLMQGACDERAITMVHVSPRGFDFAPERILRDGDMVYRPAISMHSMRVEQHMWHAGVASFHLDPDGPLFANINAMATFARAGLAVPRTYPLTSDDRDLMRTYVDALGGLPVVVKALGYSRGVGTIRADSLPSLFSIVDYALAEGSKPLLTAYVPDAVHWRVTVVGDRAVSGYRNVLDEDDFRTSGSEDPADYSAPLPVGTAEMAVAACRALRQAHGGVDILEHPSGRLYLLEANFPCYYAQSQLEAGVDVAGAMAQYLLEQAEALSPPSDAPMPPLNG